MAEAARSSPHLPRLRRRRLAEADCEDPQSRRRPRSVRRAWSPSTIHGNPKRGTGILNNELYVGRMVWNRHRFLKNPDTGKRVSRPNPESEWMSRSVPGCGS